MKSESKLEVILILNKDESEWLKAVMQNPLHGLDPESEGELDKYMRKTFWDNLIKEGVK